MVCIHATRYTIRIIATQFRLTYSPYIDAL